MPLTDVFRRLFNQAADEYAAEDRLIALTGLTREEVRQVCKVIARHNAGTYLGTLNLAWGGIAGGDLTWEQIKRRAEQYESQADHG